MLILAVAMLALSRAEIVERMKAPVVTHADGMVQVFANCPEDMRREFQSPVARFAAETVRTLRTGLAIKAERYRSPGIVVHIGDVRTNVSEVVATAVTNDTRVFTRIKVRAPAFADLQKFRLEVVKAFFRCERAQELTDEEARRAYRSADPELRIEDERLALEDWFCRGKGSDEEGFRLMRKILKPGFASRRDVLLFASRLFLYPPQYDIRFAGGVDVVSFRDAVELSRRDPCVRLVAAARANTLPVFGGGRGPRLSEAAEMYRLFLLELAKGEKTDEQLLDILDEADIQLNIAYEKSEPVAGL
jgi:hypothetical protein